MSHPHEKTHQYIWTGIVLAFFSIQAVIWSVAITLTANDTSRAVIPDYDKKALHWDEAQAKRRASQALGWQTDLKVETSGDSLGVRMAELRLNDQAGNPIETPQVTLEAFHVGHAARVQQVVLDQIEPGLFTGSIRVTRSGRWQFSGKSPDWGIESETEHSSLSKN